MPQPGPFLPRGRGPAHRLAFGTGARAVLGRHRGLLYRAGRFAGRSPSRSWSRDAGRQAEEESPETWLWHGRKVRVVDGVHHHHARHRRRIRRPIHSRKLKSPAVVFPIARILVIFSLSVGTVLGSVDRKIQGQTDRRKQLVSRTSRYVDGRRHHPCGPLFQRLVRYCSCRSSVASTSWFASTNFAIRISARAGDWAETITWFVWRRPQRPTWMSAEQYADLPEELTLREVRVRVLQKGFRTRSLVVVTTLARRRTISTRGDCLVVPAAMAGGVAFAESEDRFANGQSAVQDSRAGPQRVL